MQWKAPTKCHKSVGTWDKTWALAWVQR